VFGFYNEVLSEDRMNKRWLKTGVSLTLILLIISISTVSANGSQAAGVIAPKARVQGLTYGQWLAEWWQYVFILPTSQNPLTGGTGNQCVFQKVGGVGLVVANSTLEEPIQCTVPAGLKLYIEVLGAECSDQEPPPFYGGTDEELRTCALTFIPQDVQASVDGIAVKNLSKYLFLSPAYDITLPDDNILGVPGGTIGRSVASGSYLMITPLTPGKHLIHVRGTYPDLEYTADKVFDLLVTP